MSKNRQRACSVTFTLHMTPSPHTVSNTVTHSTTLNPNRSKHLHKLKKPASKKEEGKKNQKKHFLILKVPISTSPPLPSNPRPLNDPSTQRPNQPHAQARVQRKQQPRSSPRHATHALTRASRGPWHGIARRRRERERKRKRNTEADLRVQAGVLIEGRCWAGWTGWTGTGCFFVLPVGRSVYRWYEVCMYCTGVTSHVDRAVRTVRMMGWGEDGDGDVFV